MPLAPRDVERIRAAGRGRVLVLTGAGVSAESGIPTFRGAGGLWRGFDASRLATPEAFFRDPATVWEWYAGRRRDVAASRPNPAHEAVARLARARDDVRDDFLLVTQNVDDLHERAGTPPERIVHVHGSLFANRCTECEHADRRDLGPPWPPPCPECGCALRPGVTWFGEMLPEAEVARVETWLGDGPVDLAVVVGTTASFGYVIDWATRGLASGGILVEVNPEPTDLSRRATLALREPAGVALPALAAVLLA